MEAAPFAVTSPPCDVDAPAPGPKMPHEGSEVTSFVHPHWCQHMFKVMIILEPWVRKTHEDSTNKWKNTEINPLSQCGPSPKPPILDFPQVLKSHPIAGGILYPILEDVYQKRTRNPLEPSGTHTPNQMCCQLSTHASSIQIQPVLTPVSAGPPAAPLWSPGDKLRPGSADVFQLFSYVVSWCFLVIQRLLLPASNLVSSEMFWDCTPPRESLSPTSSDSLVFIGPAPPWAKMNKAYQVIPCNEYPKWSSDTDISYTVHGYQCMVTAQSNNCVPEWAGKKSTTKFSGVEGNLPQKPPWNPATQTLLSTHTRSQTHPKDKHTATQLIIPGFHPIIQNHPNQLSSFVQRF